MRKICNKGHRIRASDKQLATVTVSFSLIFAFNLVASSDEIVKLCSSMDAFKNSLFAVNILIVFVICFLINYTTKFMFEKRSKELGTYMLLGIEKKEIAHLVVIENILLGILAFVLAIPIGFLFSQFVSLVIVNLLGIPKTLFISLNFVSIGLLIIYFLIFSVCGIDIRVLDDELAEALKKLPERKRNTLLMYYFLEMTESEIANLQKITQSGVFRNRHHALETMKKILKEKQ